MRSSSARARPRRQSLWGLLVLLVVAVAALVVPQVWHPPVVGSASRGPVPGPPAVGDCLLGPALNRQQQSQDRTQVHPWLRTGQCQGRRFGEIAAVLTSPDLPRAADSAGPHTDANNRATGADPYLEPCRAAVRLWVGLSPGSVVGQWTPDPLSLASLMSGPSQVQRLSGQGWVACIAVMGGGSGGRSTTVGYDSTAHNLLNPGPPLPMFAYCTPTVDDDEQVPCTRAHTAERFGWMARPGGVTEQDDRDCQALAHQLTGPLLGLSDRPIPIT